jgi:hypothetical protein
LSQRARYVLSDHEKYLISELPNTEYGQALIRWIKNEVAILEDLEEHGAKICNDPLHDDFRVQLGIKIGFKRVLRLPEESKPK